MIYVLTLVFCCCMAGVNRMSNEADKEYAASTRFNVMVNKFITDWLYIITCVFLCYTAAKFVLGMGN